AYMPTVDFTYNLGRSHSWTQNPDAGYSGRNLSSKTTFSASWLAFDSLQREMNILAAQHSLRGTEAAEQDARRLLLRAVAYAYNEVMLANAQIRIAKANMKFNYALLKETELKFEAGASPLSDALNFKVNYNSAESSRYSAEYAATAAKLALAQLLGLTEGVIPDSVDFPTMPSPDGEMLAGIDYYLDLALKNRPDLKQYREAYESAKYSYYSTLGAFGPTVTLSMSVNYNHGRNRTHDQWHRDSDAVSKPRSWGMNYGVNVNWELFSGGRRYFTMKAAEASVSQAEYQIADAWISVITDVRTAYENYQTNLKLVKLNQKNLELVRKQRDLVNREYKAGSTGITRLNEAQTALIDAENALVKAVINMNNAKAQLDAATNSQAL
ncbi:MAG: TolC family protein, partial [Lentisphaeria bacterium]|nr:TolC family protein [Lentisphaeria bacterium]